MTNEQAIALRDTIEQLAGVGASDAAEIAKPFVALGEGGGLIATQLVLTRRFWPRTWAKKFRRRPGNYRSISPISPARAAPSSPPPTASTRRNCSNSTISSSPGRPGRAYLLVIDALTRGVADFADKQTLAILKLKDSVPSFEAAEAGVVGLSRAQSDLGGAVDAAKAKLAAQRATLEAGRQALVSVAASDQKAFEAANKTAEAIDRQGTEIQRLKNQIEVLGTGLTKAMASAWSRPDLDRALARGDLAGATRPRGNDLETRQPIRRRHTASRPRAEGNPGQVQGFEGHRATG